MLRVISVVVLSALLGCSSGESPAQPVPSGSDAAGGTMGDAAAADAPIDSLGSDSADVIQEASTDGGPYLSRRYSGSEGSLDYLVHAPSAKRLPVVVLMHGCNQNALELADVIGAAKRADASSFIAVLPNQPAGANPYHCWNWFSTAHQTRDKGEAALVAATIKQVIQEFDADSSKVFVAGLSAGGAMAVVVSVVFPDLVAGVGTMAGCPFRGVPCVQGASSESVSKLASDAFAVMGEHKRWLPLFAVQGASDTVVPKQNLDVLVGQWLGIGDLIDDGTLNQSVSREPSLSDPRLSEGGLPYTFNQYTDKQGKVMVETLLVEGLGHAWSGGEPGQTFSAPNGPDALGQMLAFWGL